MKNLRLFCILFFFFSTLSANIDDPTLRVSLSVALDSFDPAEAEDFVTVRVLLNLSSGLVSLNKNLIAEPAAAISWKISGDKKKYIFTLGKYFWSDGKPLVAAEFVKGFEHSFSPNTTAKLVEPLLDVIDGARDYKTKKIKDFSLVGVKALDETHLEIKLKRPTSYFLTLLALPVAFPQKRDSTSWSIKEGSPSCGAYILKEFNSRHILLLANKKFREPVLNNLEFRVIQEPSTALSIYEKGDLDLFDRLPSEDFERLKENPELVKAPWLSTYYIGFNQTKAPFNKVEARRAFVESINRKETVGILRDPQNPSSSWVPTPLETSDKTYGAIFDVKAAKNDWKNISEKSLDFYFDSQEKNILIASRIQNEIEQNLGVKLNLKPMEWKSYLKYLREDSPSLFRFAWLAAFPDVVSHLSVFKSHNPNNYTGYANEKYDSLVDEIAETPKGFKRTKLIEKAQRILLDEDVVIMPLYHYIQYDLIRSGLQGLDLTPMGVLYFHKAHRLSSP